jgi:hypothetical protein
VKLNTPKYKMYMCSNLDTLLFFLLLPVIVSFLSFNERRVYSIFTRNEKFRQAS